MFCKSGILIFIFAENNYIIYAHAMLIKTPLLHQNFGPCVFLSFLSLSLSLSLEACWAHFLPWASKTLSRRRTAPSPTREGAWCLRAAAWALRTGLTLLAFHVNQGISASFSLLLSRPPGSGPLKDQQRGMKKWSKREAFEKYCYFSDSTDKWHMSEFWEEKNQLFDYLHILNIWFCF